MWTRTPEERTDHSLRLIKALMAPRIDPRPLRWKNDRYHEWRSCTKKRAFATLETAEATALELNAQPDCWHRQAAYACWFGAHWHVGRMYVPRTPRTDFQTAEELSTFYGFGERETRCMMAENFGTSITRQQAISRRFRNGIRRAARQLPPRRSGLAAFVLDGTPEPAGAPAAGD